jgi:hypothetical protein
MRSRVMRSRDVGRVSVSLSSSRLLARLAYSVDFIRELLTQIAHLGA